MRGIVLSIAAVAQLAACTTLAPPLAEVSSGPQAKVRSVAINPAMIAGLVLNRPFQPVAVLEISTKRDDPNVPETFGGLSSMRLLGSSPSKLRFEVLSDSAHIGVIEVPNTMALNAPSQQFDTQTPTTMTPIRGPDGAVLSGAREVDSEALASSPDGRLISFERNHRLLSLSNHSSSEEKATKNGPQLVGFEGLEPNGGIEAMTRLPDGRYFAAAEFGRTDQGPEVAAKANYWVFSLDQAGPISPIGTITNASTFGMTEARVMDNQLWLLKRSWVQATNVTTVHLESCNLVSVLAAAPACRLEMVIAAPFPIDNYEGLEIVKESKTGDLFFFILSDDNFSATQKTLLLTFKLPAAAAPR